MPNSPKLAFLAAVAASIAAAPAYADGVPVIPQYQLPSELPGFAATAPQPNATAAHRRALYNSVVVPNYSGTSADHDWAYDAEWSTTGRGNSGH